MTVPANYGTGNSVFANFDMNHMLILSLDYCISADYRTRL